MANELEPEVTERFVDEAQTVIAPQSSWHELTYSQLLDTKTQIMNKAWSFKNHPAISKVLNASIVTLDKLLAERIS